MDVQLLLLGGLLQNWLARRVFPPG
jgi:hypothetical protein